MNSIKKLIIIDEFLENKVGHYYEYDKSVIDSFVQKGVQCKLYAKNTIAEEITEEIKAIPYFHYNPNLWFRKIKFLGPFLYRFYNWKILRQQIEEIIVKEYVDGQGIAFFIPNIFWYNVLPYAKAFSKFKYPVYLLYRTSVLEAIDIDAKYKSLIFKLYNWSHTLFSKSNQVHFVSDSEVIATQFEQKYHKQMTVLPIPHVFEMEDLKDLDKQTFRLYLPGNARIEKGINNITLALEYLQMNHPQYIEKLIIVLQFFGDKEKEELDALKIRIDLLNCKTVFLGKLSSDEYKEQVGLADIILIPYLNERGYKARTSGVLAEAIAACKPFVTTKESWMDVQVKNYHTGISVSDTNPEELGKAIIELIDNYENYKLNALHAKGKWMEFHSKKNFYYIMNSIKE